MGHGRENDGYQAEQEAGVGEKCGAQLEEGGSEVEKEFGM